MAKEKRDSDLTPLEVEKRATERNEEFNPWALAVGQTVILNVFGEKWGEKNPLLAEKLKNQIAANIIAARDNEKARSLGIIRATREKFKSKTS